MIAIPSTWWRWLARIAFTLTLAVVSGLAFTSSSPEISSWFSDKFNHALAFFVLALLLEQTREAMPFWRGLILPLVAYGLLIEIVQGQLGYREMSLLDVAADCIGLLIYGVLQAPIKKIIGKSFELQV
jgi:VanZ family protein